MKMVRRMKVAAAALLMMVASQTVHAQVLEQVPPDALVVVKFNNLKSVSDKFSKFLNDLGVLALPGVPEELGDPLGSLQNHLGIKEGVKTDGDAAYVFVDPALIGVGGDAPAAAEATNKAADGGDAPVPHRKGPEEAFVLLIPVSDYKAFLGNFKDAKVVGDVAEVKIGESPEPGYVVQRGNYALLTPSKALTALKGGGMKTATATTKDLMSKELVLLANLPALRTKVEPHYKEWREKAIEEVDKAVDREGEDRAKYKPVFNALVNRGFDVLESFLRDGDDSTVSLHFAEEGLKIAVASEFKGGSYLGNFVGSIKSNKESVTAGLPAGKYIFYGGGTSDPAITEKLLNDLANPIISELKKVESTESKAIIDYIDALKLQLNATKGQTMGLVATRGQMGKSAIFQFICITEGDAKALRTRVGDGMKKQMAMQQVLGGGGGTKTEVKPGAKTVDGVAFDTAVTSVDPNSTDPNAEQIRQMFTFMFGQDGMTIHFADISANKLLTVSGDDALISAALKAAKANEDTVGASEALKSVNANLPQMRTSAGYLALDELVNTGMHYAQQMGFGMQLQLPELKPIGFTVGNDGTQLRIDTYIPTETIQQLISAGMQAAANMQGGQRGGPGGL